NCQPSGRFLPRKCLCTGVTRDLLLSSLSRHERPRPDETALAGGPAREYRRPRNKGRRQRARERQANARSSSFTLPRIALMKLPLPWNNGRTLSGKRAPRPGKKRNPRPSFRPWLEPLEGRVLPATQVWTGAAGVGNWSNAANWQSGVAPSAGD